MDERTPELPLPGEAEQGDVAPGETPAEPPAGEPTAAPVEPTWTTPPPEAAEAPDTVWKPAVWEPAVEETAPADAEAPTREDAPKASRFRRKPKAEEEPREETEQAAKTPFWKKELSLKRAPKAAKARRAPKRPKQARPAQKKVVGLKIGASQLAAARVAKGASPQLAQVARAPLAPGIVVGGEVRDSDRLAEALRTFFAKNKLPKRGVRLGIASNRIGVRVFELEGIDDPRQLANAIRFRAQEALPIPLDEAVLDYQVLEERVRADGAVVHRVLLVVAYRELIER